MNVEVILTFFYINERISFFVKQECFKLFGESPRTMVFHKRCVSTQDAIQFLGPASWRAGVEYGKTWSSRLVTARKKTTLNDW